MGRVSYTYEKNKFLGNTPSRKWDAADARSSTAGLSVLINKSLLDDFSPSMSVT